MGTTEKAKVTDLTGLSAMKVLNLSLTNVDMSITSAGLKGNANFQLSGGIPQLKAQLGRHGMLGNEQTWTIDMPQVKLTWGISGTVKLGGGSGLEIAAITVPDSQLQFKSMQIVSGNGPLFTEGMMNELLDSEAPKIKAGLAASAK